MQEVVTVVVFTVLESTLLVRIRVDVEVEVTVTWIGLIVIVFVEVVEGTVIVDGGRVDVNPVVMVVVAVTNGV